MRYMNEGVSSPASEPATPTVSPQALLAAIAAAGDELWFPSSYAAATGIPRDALDEPLTDLRLAGLIEVATWVKGRGQGYRLTTAGREALHGRSPTTAVVPPAEQAGSLFVHSVPLNLRPLVVVWMLAAACLLVFFAGLLLAGREHGSFYDYLSGHDLLTAYRLGAVRGYDLLAGQWYRLLTANFVHIGWLHLLANLLALVLLGVEAETVYGRWRLLWLFLCSGIGGISTAMASSPDTLLAGASAAIWGLLAALAVWLLIYRRHLQPVIFQRTLARLGIIIVFNLLLSLAPGISLAGHLGGALWGAVAARWMLATQQTTAPFLRRFLQVGTLGLPLVPTLLLLAWMHWSPNWEGTRTRYEHERQRRRLQEIQEHFQHYIAPRLEQLQPRTIEQLERQAILQLLRPAARRDSAATAYLHEQIRQRLQDAQAVQTWLDQIAAIPAPLGRLYQPLHDYVATVQHALQLLDLMLDEPEIPSEMAWHHWGQTRRRLEQLWQMLQLFRVAKLS